ncbi:hypothetical protein C7447_10322 [Tenacibaculum adriaticum]|uniref:Tetratricopeptide repeat protein n=1 Tax=Tenacibaculum adriaticum TaxID=413713 RepID=A0A5S5DPM3_9FLAO|nr:hypothetical protein [Tenacibaculum adriaticum]TYP97857.1 hypothetical protein C7447_10322 [Tenacibaculum adriaticum]
MVKSDYIALLNNPRQIEQHNAFELKAIVDKYPYFQSARALYLKTLKNQESFKYNNELKITAAYTTDRTILFNFITSKVFTDVIKKESQEKEKVTQHITSESNFTEITEELEIGKPLPFTRNETHSFNQWLQLAAKKPIIREAEPEKKSEKATIIDNFIANSPKIPRVSKAISSEVKSIEKPQFPQLMTETLAKVYLEQKKYENAIKAYEILSLKYPEKSGFFADQIKRIQILQNNK